MTAGDLVDKWFGGPLDKKRTDPRERLKGLRGVSLQGRIDFNRGLLFGRLKKEGFEFKYPAWGFYPLMELAELETMAIAYFARLDIAAYEQERAKADIAAALNIPQSQIEQNKKVSTSMANFFKGPLA
jgi:hypothetical protein